MTIVLNERSRVVGLWFAHAGSVDWMACVWRDRPRHEWTVRGRFRYRRDELLPWQGSDDDKVWSASTIPASATEDEVLKAMNHVAERIGEAIGATPAHVSCIAIKGGVDDLVRAASKHEWFNRMFIGEVPR